MTKFTLRVSDVGRNNVMSHLGLRNVHASKLLTVIADSNRIPSIKGELTIPTGVPEGSEFVVSVNTEDVNELDVVYELLEEFNKSGFVGPEILFSMLGRIK